MSSKLFMAVALSAFTAAAFAGDAARAEAEKVIDLKDGSTVYIFKDGKMAMEDEFGRVIRMDQGTVMESKDGQKIVMNGDEVMRLRSLLKRGHGGGSR